MECSENRFLKVEQKELNFDIDKTIVVEERTVEPKQTIDFIRDIEIICKKHNLSISHEDAFGAFIIEDYKESNLEWLKAASYDNP